jgi:thiamine biosynthesis lipoprotein
VFLPHISTFVLALTALFLAGCQTTHNSQPLRRGQPLLGTFVVVTAYGEHDAATRAITAAFDEIRRIDSLMSLHRSDSELSKLNATAVQQPLVVSSDLFLVISNALAIARETDGAFDPTVAPLTELWGFLWKDHRLPIDSELASVLPRVNYKLVELDPKHRTVHFKTNGVSLDLNAIAKGYVVDCAINKLRSLGITNAMVRAGGDLRVIGAPPGQSAWPIQIEDPTKDAKRRTLELRDAALSTSGSYENYFVANGRRYSHIFNPRTGRPIEGIASCSVIAPTCMQSDAWATAFFVLGPETALRDFGRRFPILFGLWADGNEIRWHESSAAKESF